MLCSDFISLQESSCNLPVILPPLFPFIPLSQSISHPLNTIQIYLSINLKHILYYQLPQQWIPSTFNFNYAYWIIPTFFRTDYYWSLGPLTMLPKNNSRLSLITVTAWLRPSHSGIPTDAQAQERQAGRNAQALAQEYAMPCYHIVFCVLPFMLSDIPGQRP